MPMSEGFRERLADVLPHLTLACGTPVVVYDEAGIRQTGERLKQLFDGLNFRQYFPVKATPVMGILKLMRNMGFGFDCSSIPELMMAQQLGASGKDIMFSSNNTLCEEFVAAREADAIINIDDISLVKKVPDLFPEFACFRYNPGAKREGNAIIGQPTDAKYGVPDEQIVKAYQMARDRGATRFGLHTMVVSNELDADSVVETVRMILEVAERLNREPGITIEFVNIGGGIGIPYKPDQQPFDMEHLARETHRLFCEFEQKNGYLPSLCMEAGRYLTGPHGVLVTRAINRMEKYKQFVGVDASMPALMRPGIYGAYHHIDVFDMYGCVKSFGDTETVNVVGSICENMDQFAWDRQLPRIDEGEDGGDLVVIQDAGAHGTAMGFQYNGRTRPVEVLLREDGSVVRLRQAETADALFDRMEDPAALPRLV